MTKAEIQKFIQKERNAMNHINFLFIHGTHATTVEKYVGQVLARLEKKAKAKPKARGGK